MAGRQFLPQLVRRQEVHILAAIDAALAAAGGRHVLERQGTHCSCDESDHQFVETQK